MGIEWRGRPKTILIAGPTASGKSALALSVAADCQGTIINADSMQVYRDLSVLTSRPSAEEMTRCDHLLYGTIDGAEPYSVSRWLADAKLAIAAVQAQNRMPILVGGSGLYFKALTQGLSAIPDVPEQIRQELRLWAAGRPPADLHAELTRRDPLTAARLLPTDPQRVLRALEVHAATGESLVAFQEHRETPVVDVKIALAVRLSLERQDLHARIDRRFDAMMETGALEEVERLLDRRLDPASPVMRAIGVRELSSYLRGQDSREKAVAAAKTATRQYVRRQDTFARNQLHGFAALSVAEANRLLQSSL